MRREELIPPSERKLLVGATAASKGKLPAPPPSPLAHVDTEHILYAERAPVSDFYKPQVARVCVRAPKAQV